MESTNLSAPVLKLAIDELKVCPVCGCVNADSNLECVICRWHGRFHREPKLIQASLGDLLEKCPELREHFGGHSVQWVRSGVLARVRKWLRKRRSIDFWA